MRIFMTGGTGFVGSTLTAALTADGHRVTVLTRVIRPGRALPAGAVYLAGDPTAEGPWQKEVQGHDAIVNLAGESIFKRWNDNTKQAIRDSRVQSTRNLVGAIGKGAGEKPKLLLNTSAVGYYGFHGDEELAEDDPAGDDFLATVVRDWETEARAAEAHGTRVVRCRFGLVLGRRGGTLGIMAPMFRKWLGSPLGDGKQWFSWIHEEDLAAIYRFLLQQDLSGPINCTAPNPVTNREMTRTLAQVLRRPTLLPPVPGFLVRAVMGEFGAVILRGQRVLPRRLQAMGFHFRFPDLEPALRDLLGPQVGNDHPGEHQRAAGEPPR